jgi:hypothetical protein
VADEFVLDKGHDRDAPDARRLGAEKKYDRLELLPGRSLIHVRCRPPSYFLPFDRRNLCYYIANFKLVER